MIRMYRRIDCVEYYLAVLNLWIFVLLHESNCMTTFLLTVGYLFLWIHCYASVWVKLQPFIVSVNGFTVACYEYMQNICAYKHFSIRTCMHKYMHTCLLPLYMDARYIPHRQNSTSYILHMNYTYTPMCAFTYKCACAFLVSSTLLLLRQPVGCNLFGSPLTAPSYAWKRLTSKHREPC